MNQPRDRALDFQWRAKLIVALIVMAALVVICAVGIGVTLHGWSETRDSLRHWQARLEEESAKPEGESRGAGIDSPRSRIQRLEQELDAVPGRLAPMGIVLVLASVLLVLGYRKLKRTA